MLLNRSKNSTKIHLIESNIMQYVENEYDKDAFFIKDTCIKGFVPLLQNDYGGDNDCTLTCITSIINYITNCKHKVNDIYNNVEKVAKKYFYNGNIGTSCLAIKAIFNKSLSKYCNNKVKSVFLKNKCCNIILSQIDKNNPLILSLIDDGLGYYKKHSVVIVGYRIYSVNRNKKVFLKIYDNWSKNISYLDYDKISFVSFLHYIA